MFSRRTSWRLAVNRFTEAQREFAAAGGGALDLTVSNPTRAGLIVDLTHDQREIAKALADPGIADYDPQPKGLLVARESVLAYYRERRAEVDAESLILTTSTSEGYSYVFRLLCDPGDEVLVPKPSYPLFEFLADLQDVKLVPYPLLYDHGWQMDLPSIERAITARTRAIVMVHPNNPTGSYVKDDERSALNALCSKGGLALIVDEVFLDYPLDREPPESFATNNGALTFTLSGVSKISGLPQMKFAWIATSGPQDVANEALERLEVIADTYLSMSAPIQLAAEAMLKQRRRIQPALLTRTQANLQELDRQLARQKGCTRLHVEGGWYAVLRVPATRTDEELVIDLLREHSVLVHPGHFYDFPSDGYLVVSLIGLEDEFREGIRRLLEYLEK
ncbi:MAG TPA: pyridoxal phosphate-dependent aminotransferase [Terriglobales bacterium]|jgi:aspartate/methionine/tyrosine aminotransferase